MVSLIVCYVRFTHYSFYRLTNWGPPKWWEPLAVAQSAPPLNPPLLQYIDWFEESFCHSVLNACQQSFSHVFIRASVLFSLQTADLPTALIKHQYTKQKYKLLVI